MLMIYKLTIFVKNKMFSFLFSLILTCTKNPIGLTRLGFIVFIFYFITLNFSNQRENRV